jgi:UDP-glucuronate decarboxylase
VINILITGAAGFIGSSLWDKLNQDKSITVVGVDNLLTGNLNNIPKRICNSGKFIKADVNHYEDISEIFYTYSFDYVFHYAAVVGVKRTLANPISVLGDIKGFENILRLSKNTGVKRVYYSSSSEVYGEPVEIPQHEHTTPLNAKLPYAVVKNLGEVFLKTYHQEFGLKYTIFRFFNTYGPKQNKDFVVSKFLDLANSNQPIPIYGDGLQTRTYCFIKDNVDTTYKILKGNFAQNEIINIGGDKEITAKDLALKIIKLTHSKSKIVYLPPLSEGDMSRRCPHNGKMKKYLNRPLISLDSGLKKIIDLQHFSTI